MRPSDMKEDPIRVYCPVCKTYWKYAHDRKTPMGSVLQPVKNKKYAWVLTCNKCCSEARRQADSPASSKDRQMQRLDRMDDEEG